MIRIRTLEKHSRIVVNIDNETQIFACDNKEEYNAILKNLLATDVQDRLREELKQIAET